MRAINRYYRVRITHHKAVRGNARVLHVHLSLDSNTLELYLRSTGKCQLFISAYGTCRHLYDAT
jgi:hypothetical protein